MAKFYSYCSNCVRDWSENPFFGIFPKKDWSEKPDPCGNAHQKGRQAQNNKIQNAVIIKIKPNNLIFICKKASVNNSKRIAKLILFQYLCPLIKKA